MNTGGVGRGYKLSAKRNDAMLEIRAVSSDAAITSKSNISKGVFHGVMAKILLIP